MGLKKCKTSVNNLTTSPPHVSFLDGSWPLLISGIGRKKIAKLMQYNHLLKKVEQGLFWLDANGRHAIELQETFTFPAYDVPIRELIKDTNKVRCYKVCLDAIYFEFVMTLMRMYDNYEHDTVCFQKIFEYLSDDFIQKFETETRRKVKGKIQSALNEFNTDFRRVLNVT